MNDPKLEDESPSKGQAKARNDCFLCGRDASGEWHYVASLGRFVCQECYGRAMAGDGAASSDRPARPRP